MVRVVVLGGYGEFGRRLAGRLVSSGVTVIVAGRSAERAGTLAEALACESRRIDIDDDLASSLEQTDADILVDCTGRFDDYRVAKACIATGINYIDLADNRAFVAGISTLDYEARQAGVFVLSGASTVPGLSSAVLAAMAERVAELDAVEYGISPGSRPRPGLATVRSILSAVGQTRSDVGVCWGDLVYRRFPGVGVRLLSRCECPDWSLFPAHFGVSTMMFRAGLEIPVLQVGMWVLAQLVRARVVRDLSRHARWLEAIASGLSRFGSDCGGMYMQAKGRDAKGQMLTIDWHLAAREGHGPFVPTLVAAALIEDSEAISAGARACVDGVRLADIEHAARGLAIDFSPITIRAATSSAVAFASENPEPRGAKREHHGNAGHEIEPGAESAGRVVQ